MFFPPVPTLLKGLQILVLPLKSLVMPPFLSHYSLLSKPCSGSVSLTDFMSLTNVLHAPKFALSLLSISQITKLWTIEQIFRSPPFFSRISGQWSRLMEALSEMDSIISSSFTNHVQLYHLHTTTLQWYLRLDHPSVTVLHRQLRNLSLIKSFKCKVCQLGKHHKSSFSSRINKTVPFV